ncbi:MAG TPA: hypothetical protein VHL10_05240 [Nitrososphaera sp.]|nr:hypothetical protein [Nitrososphaera sp.]
MKKEIGMKVLQQGVFRSAEEVTALHMIDFKRTNGYWEDNTLKGIETVASWLVGTTAYTVAEIDLSRYPTRSDWPGWNHRGYHEPIGKLYWNFFFAQFEKQGGKLCFSDAPDFAGSFIDTEGVERRVFGDVGEVSVSTFVLDVLPHLRDQDLWISVLDEHHQVILEPLINLQEEIARTKEKLFGLDRLARRKGA